MKDQNREKGNALEGQFLEPTRPNERTQLKDSPLIRFSVASEQLHPSTFPCIEMLSPFPDPAGMGTMGIRRHFNASFRPAKPLKSSWMTPSPETTPMTL